MSLLASASLWTNDDSTTTNTNGNKKRTPAMRRPVRKSNVVNDENGWKSNSKISNEDLYISDDTLYQENTIQSTQDEQSERNARVNTLLNQLTDANDGNKLADFQPITPPAIQNRLQISSSSPSNPLQIPTPQVIQRSSPFMPTSTDLGNTTNTNPYGNYKNVYDPETMKQIIQTQTASLPVQTIDSRMMDKINYMIHMLEQQQNEKTSNITEEFILYTFLGVFIIFIVDSFARAGRYTR